MLKLHQWINERKQRQSLIAIFNDCWFCTYGRACASNQVEIDAKNYERCLFLPSYVKSSFEKERQRCNTVH